jgi:hypothetical protein
VAVVTRNGIADVEERTAKKVVTTGCGQGSVFGGLMDEVDQITCDSAARLRQSVVYRIVDTIRTQQSIYKQAGSVHGCALFSKRGELLYFVEDVGRHNAVDAIAGLMWLDGVRRRQGVLHHRPPDLRNGDQGRADGHSLPAVALGHHPDGAHGRRKGRHVAAGALHRQAFPAAHRARAARLFEPALLDCRAPAAGLMVCATPRSTPRRAFALLFSGDAALWRIIWVSLKTSVLGAAARRAAGRAARLLRSPCTASPGGASPIWLAAGALSLPTVLIGLLLYLLLSRRGPLGSLEWLFSQPGIIARPVADRAAGAAGVYAGGGAGADPRYAETAIALGASRWRVTLTVLHEVRFGVMAA